MRMYTHRFGEYSNGTEFKAIALKDSRSLKALEGVPALLMYERGTKCPNCDVVRYGNLKSIQVAGEEITFLFIEEGRLSRGDIEEYCDRLGIDSSEFNRNHWAVKDGSPPEDFLARQRKSYDVFISHASEDKGSFVDPLAQELTGLVYDALDRAGIEVTIAPPRYGHGASYGR